MTDSGCFLHMQLCINTPIINWASGSQSSPCDYLWRRLFAFAFYACLCCNLIYIKLIVMVEILGSLPQTTMALKDLGKLHLHQICFSVFIYCLWLRVCSPIFACVSVCLCMVLTLGAVLADIGPLCIAWVWTCLAALIEGHTQVSTGDWGTRRQALLSLMCPWAVHPAQLARGVNITQAQPHTSLPGAGIDT